MVNITHNIDAIMIDNSIEMLNKYIKETGIKPLISILEALKEDPTNTSLFAQLTDALNNLGPIQGAVLTYAPYIIMLLSDDPFGND